MEIAVNDVLDTKILYLIMMGVPLLAVLTNRWLFKTNPENGARSMTIAIWIGLFVSSIGLVRVALEPESLMWLGLKIDGLAWTMNMLVFFVSAIVHQFSRRYMAGDSAFQRYFVLLSLITLSAALMISSDNTVLFWCAWTISNFLLVSLMAHKKHWSQARNAGRLALKTLLIGSSTLGLALAWLYVATGSLSIAYIWQQAPLFSATTAVGVLLLIIMTSFVQSAQWPFHRWLLSSLNSPTPISALMHAGLVNGGGLVLVKFAPLFLTNIMLLNIVFLIGAVSAIVGTLWKLIQTDVKRMLACSTMAQMGFMMMQCGLGLFPAAVAHLCWHGLFKSFLFLNAGSVLRSKKEPYQVPENAVSTFLLAALMGCVGAYGFAVVSEKTIFTLQATTFLVGFAFISGTQLAFTMLQTGRNLFMLLTTLILVSIAGIFYGESIYFIESFLPMITPDELMVLNPFNTAVFVIFLMLWLGMNLNTMTRFQKSTFWARLYVILLNSSQPHPDTVTSMRKHYQI